MYQKGWNRENSKNIRIIPLVIHNYPRLQIAKQLKTLKYFGLSESGLVCWGIVGLLVIQKEYTWENRR